MSSNYHTPLTSNSQLDAPTLNGPLGTLDAAIGNIINGVTTIVAKIANFTNAQHDHEDAAGGGKLTSAAIDSGAATDGQVLTADGAGGAAFESINLVPTGAIMMWPNPSAPSGWLFCDGRAVSTTTYADLYAQVGGLYRAYGTINSSVITTVLGLNLQNGDTLNVFWSGGSRTGCTISSGGGTGSLTLTGGTGDALPSGGTAITFFPNYPTTAKFMLPDLRGRFALGFDNMGGAAANRTTDTNADTYGGNGGAENVTLTTSQIPAHSHELVKLGSVDAAAGGASTANQWGNTDGRPTTGTFFAFATNNAGGGGSHNNMPPWLGINYIIKT